jgi:SnoaL-like domain
VTLHADHAAVLWIERCLLRVPVIYARGIDRRDWKLVRSCFADDAYVQGSRTTAALDEYLPQLRLGVEYFPATMHFIGNKIVDVGDDNSSGHYRSQLFRAGNHRHVTSVKLDDRTAAGTLSHDRLYVGRKGLVGQRFHPRPRNWTLESGERDWLGQGQESLGHNGAQRELSLLFVHVIALGSPDHLG